MGSIITIIYLIFSVMYFVVLLVQRRIDEIEEAQNIQYDYFVPECDKPVSTVSLIAMAILWLPALLGALIVGIIERALDKAKRK